MKKAHFIAIGGSAMHNLAIALKENGWDISGSDDEIYEPSLSRLKQAGICPPAFGWYPEKITADLDAIVLGMHARKDNPELIKALDMGVKVVSYPEFLYQNSKDKKRIVIAGSHGKTTTTSMIMHVLKACQVDADYMVGAQLEGFDTMVRLSDAPLIVLEGDEYLSSPLDARSKFSHYHPDITVITGVSWDHINVFPSKDEYINRFSDFIDQHDEGTTIFYYRPDHELTQICSDSTSKAQFIPYHELVLNDNKEIVIGIDAIPFPLIGKHNLANACAAWKVCKLCGISDLDFFQALQYFKGARKRLQRIYENEDSIGFLDFAHAPSKVKATSGAVKEWYPTLSLVAVLELHTYSSLNRNFLPEYKHTLAAADEVVVFYDPHTVAMKKMAALDEDEVARYFDHPNIKVLSSKEACHKYLNKFDPKGKALLLMSSGTFGGYDLNKLNPW